MAVTRTVFCAVTAVIALVPYTPSAANVFRSAWMPAPPPESLPAMVSTARGGAGACSGSTFRWRGGFPEDQQELERWHRLASQQIEAGGLCRLDHGFRVHPVFRGR